MELLPLPIELAIPKVYCLKGVPFVSPTLLRACTNQEVAVVVEPNVIDYNGTRHYPTEPLEVGKKVVLCHYNSFHFGCQYEQEVLAFKQYRQELQAVQRINEQRRLAEKEANRKRQIAEFWAQYNLPFAYTVEHKEVLSGLSAHSGGNGMKRNSVEHIYLLEAAQIGKAQRQAHDFLCSPAKSKFGGNWSGTLGTSGSTETQVTCPKCLKMIERFKKPHTP